MSERCADHQAEANETCGICQRPLCPRCKREGPLPKCAKCMAQDAALPGRRSGVPRWSIFALLLGLGLLAWMCTTCGACLHEIHT